MYACTCVEYVCMHVCTVCMCVCVCVRASQASLNAQGTPVNVRTEYKSPVHGDPVDVHKPIEKGDLQTIKLK